MERSIAIKKLRKLLGKSLAYRIDPNAPTREERVGSSDGFFFTVLAQGDSWEHVVEKLTKKKAS